MGGMHGVEGETATSPTKVQGDTVEARTGTICVCAPSLLRLHSTLVIILQKKTSFQVLITPMTRHEFVSAIAPLKR